MDDELDDLFDTKRGTENWRDGLSGDALTLCETIEARIEATGKAPTWTKVRSALARRGVVISAGSIGGHYRAKYPQLRKDK